MKIIIDGKTFDTSGEAGGLGDMSFNPREVRILDGVFCRRCEWPVIAIKCSADMRSCLDDCEYDPDNEVEFWFYCANKTCSCHDGAGASPATKGDPT